MSRENISNTLLVSIILLLILDTCTSRISSAGLSAWTRDDAVSAVIAAADEHHLSRAEVLCITWLEAHWDPAARGDSGRAHGLAQLREDGKAPAFRAAGYTDPDNPYQAAQFLAQQLSLGAGPHHWARSWRLCNG
jgi:hypothetical protein